ncbi:unnamed protein product (mitochondrion) [Plasmodiophora brassicae]|uniref:Zinc transporter ZupT n=1 Tax=Plasmodiophora brassicae TaxID=37360 RepID=A0A0G4IWU1_PLABS|nr:hypothetical protein PBRA_007532 [Plasmodiophora brassicae]SPR02109.1 unnamed protein product [Plasmodiophora brassicae]
MHSSPAHVNVCTLYTRDLLYHLEITGSAHCTIFVQASSSYSNVENSSFAMSEQSKVLVALAVSFGAATATTVGALAAMFVKRENKLILAGSMSVSAGVLTYVSLMDVMTAAKGAFEQVSWIGPGYGPLLASTIFFFIGIGVVALLDKLTHRLQPDGVPGHGTDLHPHQHDESDRDVESSIDVKDAVDNESSSGEHVSVRPKLQQKKLRVAMVVTAIAVAVHNFPEGVASFIATRRDPKVGLPVAFAIAVHNIPEGLCVAMPIFFATGNRAKAIAVAAGTGALEFIGALFACILPNALFSDFFFGAIFAGTAGMMMFVSFVELLPVARLNDPENKVMTKCIFMGMFVMAISLVLLAAAGID